MRSNNLVLVAIVAAVLVPATAIAQSTIGQRMTSLAEEAELLRVKVELAELQAKYDALTRSQSPKGGISEVDYVEWVEGLGQERVAKLRTADGRSIEVRAGDRLPDGTVVKAIQATRVAVIKNGREQWLAFNSPAAAPASNNSVLSPR